MVVIILAVVKDQMRNESQASREGLAMEKSKIDHICWVSKGTVAAPVRRGIASTYVLLGINTCKHRHAPMWRACYPIDDPIRNHRVA